MSHRATESSEIGRCLLAARLQRGLSQKDVARRAGMASSSLSRIENGRVRPSIEVAMRITRAIGVDLADVVRVDAHAGCGPCPVTRDGACLLHLIAPSKTDGRFTPRDVSLLRRFASWLERADAERVKAMEVLLGDLAADAREPK